jgi:probable DNA metabolism protein
MGLINELRYDGTFAGLLSAIYECYTKTMLPDTIATTPIKLKSIFDLGYVLNVETDEAAARRLYQRIVRKGGHKAGLQVYKTFLSEVGDKEMLIYEYLKYLFNSTHNSSSAKHRETVWRIQQLEYTVGREQKRALNNIEFNSTVGNIDFAIVDPDFDILPLVANDVMNTKTIGQWIIYDSSRNYGMHYDGVELKAVEVMHDGYHVGGKDLWKLEWGLKRIRNEYLSLIDNNLRIHVNNVTNKIWQYTPERSIA